MRREIGGTPHWYFQKVLGVKSHSREKEQADVLCHFHGSRKKVALLWSDGTCLASGSDGRESSGASECGE